MLKDAGGKAVSKEPLVKSTEPYSTKIRKQDLTVSKFVNTIRQTTDRCNQLSWHLMSAGQQHNTLVEMSETVITDLFSMIAECFANSSPKAILDDFYVSFASKHVHFTS
jgi:hypothetical protein